MSLVNSRRADEMMACCAAGLLCCGLPGLLPFLLQPLMCHTVGGGLRALLGLLWAAFAAAQHRRMLRWCGVRQALSWGAQLVLLALTAPAYMAFNACFEGPYAQWALLGAMAVLFVWDGSPAAPPPNGVPHAVLHASTLPCICVSSGCLRPAQDGSVCHGRMHVICTVSLK
jgi:hypothetical protein